MQIRFHVHINGQNFMHHQISQITLAATRDSLLRRNQPRRSPPPNADHDPPYEIQTPCPRRADQDPRFLPGNHHPGETTVWRSPRPTRITIRPTKSQPRVPVGRIKIRDFSPATTAPPGRNRTGKTSAPFGVCHDRHGSRPAQRNPGPCRADQYQRFRPCDHRPTGNHRAPAQQPRRLPRHNASP